MPQLLEREALDRIANKARQHRHNIIWGVITGLLCLIAIVEAVIIYEQKRVNEHIEAQSEEAMGRFLKQGQSASGKGAGVDILFRNVRFCWSQKICINSSHLAATAQPLSGNMPLLFDNLKSYIVNVHNADVLITPLTLQGMFNESVFNYPGSKLRNLSVGIAKQSDGNHVMLRGSLNYILWIPFEMDTKLAVDQKSNTLLISVNTLKVFGFIPATWLIDLKPFNLDKLLTLPANRYLTVHQNVMMVKPFGLFPPPRINGKMAQIAVTPQFIQLKFSGSEPAFGSLSQSASNFIAVRGGAARFGNIQMLNTDVEVIDRNPQSLFQFSLLNYLDYLPQSEVRLLKNGGAVLKMSDIGRLSSGEGSLQHPENATEAERHKFAPQPENFFQKAKAKIKGWFGL
jgi:hypothetical protein